LFLALLRYSPSIRCSAENRGTPSGLSQPASAEPGLCQARNLLAGVHFVVKPEIVTDEYLANHWWLKAAEAAAIASHLGDPSCQRVMYRIAAGYEEMARAADRHQQYEQVLPNVDLEGTRHAQGVPDDVLSRTPTTPDR